MYQINSLCKHCNLCVKNCPALAIKVLEGKQVISDTCVECGICIRSCPFNAIDKIEEDRQITGCKSCPVECKIPNGGTGACKRYTNENGRIVRNRALIMNNTRVELPGENIRKPIITAVGAGTNYPCSKPAPYIVSQCREGVDVVTVVTEAPLSYSGVIVKLDTNTYIGEEGDKVYLNNRIIGMVNTEEYGSKMIAIGGANSLTGKNGFQVAQTIVDLANGNEVEISVAKKTKIRVQTGKAPVINGIEEKKMRIGCGSATVGLFAALIKDAVDECIVIDHHVIGLASEHLAGEDVGMKYSGVIPNARRSTRGRYFGEHGEGIGGTSLMTPREAIAQIDMKIAKAGMEILVVNTTGEVSALFEILEDGNVAQKPMSEKAGKVVKAIYDNCEESKVSVMYSGGTGGSARGGVCNYPLALSRAVHSGKAILTVGGAPTYVMPGGGINFIVDTNSVVDKAFTWVPTPATVAPIEYTMTKEDYESIGGHMSQIISVEDINWKD
jgi:Fe-S-cluster-containing dehydrogenase component